MDFNNIVKTILGPTLTENSFVIDEEGKDYIAFKNSAKNITIRLGLYRYGGNEMSVSLSLGDEYFHIEDSLEFYGNLGHIPIHLRDEGLAKESLEMLKNILLRNNGELLNGDKECFAKLIAIRNKTNKEYNDKRDLEYLTNQANTAWNDKDYSKFIELVGPKIDKFPGSYAKKLEIAKKRQEQQPS